MNKHGHIRGRGTPRLDQRVTLRRQWDGGGVMCTVRYVAARPLSAGAAETNRTDGGENRNGVHMDGIEWKKGM